MPMDPAAGYVIGNALAALIASYLQQQEKERQRSWERSLRREDWRNRLLERMMPSFGDLYSIAQMEERRRRWSTLENVLKQIFTPYYQSIAGGGGYG